MFEFDIGFDEDPWTGVGLASVVEDVQCKSGKRGAQLSSSQTMTNAELKAAEMAISEEKFQGKLVGEKPKLKASEEPLFQIFTTEAIKSRTTPTVKTKQGLDTLEKDEVAALSGVEAHKEVSESSEINWEVADEIEISTSKQASNFEVDEENDVTFQSEHQVQTDLSHRKAMTQLNPERDNSYRTTSTIPERVRIVADFTEESYLRRIERIGNAENELARLKKSCVSNFRKLVSFLSYQGFRFKLLLVDLGPEIFLQKHKFDVRSNVNREIVLSRTMVRKPYIKTDLSKNFQAAPPLGPTIFLPVDGRVHVSWTSERLKKLKLCVRKAYCNQQIFFAESRFEQLLMKMNFKPDDLIIVEHRRQKLNEELWRFESRSRKLKKSKRRMHYEKMMYEYFKKDVEDFDDIIKSHERSNSPITALVVARLDHKSWAQVQLKDVLSYRQKALKQIYFQRLSSNRINLKAVDWKMVSKEMSSTLKKPISEDHCKRKFQLCLYNGYNHGPETDDEVQKLKCLTNRRRYIDWESTMKKLGTNRTKIRGFSIYRTQIASKQIDFMNDDADVKIKQAFFRSQGDVTKAATLLSEDYGDIHLTTLKSAYWRTINPRLEKSRFSVFEDALLLVAMELQRSEILRPDFADIRRYLPWRLCTTWRARANVLVNIESFDSKWTIAEDRLLLKMVDADGLTMAGCGKVLSSKRKSACWGRYRRLKQRLGEITLEEYHEIYSRRKVVEPHHCKRLFDIASLLKNIIQEKLNQPVRQKEFKCFDCFANRINQKPDFKIPLISPPTNSQEIMEYDHLVLNSSAGVYDPIKPAGGYGPGNPAEGHGPVKHLEVYTLDTTGNPEKYDPTKLGDLFDKPCRCIIPEPKLPEKKQICTMGTDKFMMGYTDDENTLEEYLKSFNIIILGTVYKRLGKYLTKICQTDELISHNVTDARKETLNAPGSENDICQLATETARTSSNVDILASQPNANIDEAESTSSNLNNPNSLANTESSENNHASRCKPSKDQTDKVPSWDRRKFVRSDPISIASALHLRRVPLIPQTTVDSLTDFETKIYTYHHIFCNGKPTKKQTKRNAIPSALELTVMPELSRIVKPSNEVLQSLQPSTKKNAPAPASTAIPLVENIPEIAVLCDEASGNVKAIEAQRKLNARREGGGVTRGKTRKTLLREYRKAAADLRWTEERKARLLADENCSSDSETINISTPLEEKCLAVNHDHVYSKRNGCE